MMENHTLLKLSVKIMHHISMSSFNGVLQRLPASLHLAAYRLQHKVNLLSLKLWGGTLATAAVELPWTAP